MRLPRGISTALDLQVLIWFWESPELWLCGPWGEWDAVLLGCLGPACQATRCWCGAAALPSYYPWLTLLDSQLCSGAQVPSQVNAHQSHHLNRDLTASYILTLLLNFPPSLKIADTHGKSQMYCPR